MEQTFLEKLRRVRAGDLLHIFKFLAAWVIHFFYRARHRDLWLFCDSEMEARDNAYWLFRYVRERHPEQEAVFAINYSSPDYARVAGLGETVPYGSLRHWALYLAASKNISSQKNGKPNAAICYLLEVYGLLRNTRVFLQHGILTANLTFLHYRHTKMRLFVCSTRKEWNYVNSHYGYPEGWVRELGLCRFDRLHDFTVDVRQVLIMPTWRMYIRNEIYGKTKEETEEAFKETDYFKHWSGLLRDEGFLALLKERDLRVVFYPHREMRRFLSAFEIRNPRITVASWPDYDVQELLKGSAYLITDFSSVAMDFAYMKKPLCYYQFDTEKFRSSHHEAADFDFVEEGFGPVCRTGEEVVRAFSAAAARGFENEEAYLRRHEAYFDLWDAQNCRRNYEAIREIGK